MKNQNKFLEQAENIIEECEEQIKNLENIVGYRLKKNINITENSNNND